MARFGMLGTGKAGARGAISAFAAAVLEKKAAGAVIIQRAAASGLNVPHAAVAGVAGLAGADPLAPVMPANAGGIIAEMTGVKAPAEGVVAFLRPCESRALVELVKLKQASLDNLTVVSFDCPGTEDLGDYKGPPADPEKDLRQRLAGGAANLRPACAVCAMPSPQFADLKLWLFGTDVGSGIPVEACTEKGSKLLDALGIPAAAQPAGREEAVAKAAAARTAARKERFASLLAGAKGPAGMVNFFAKCVRCQNCRRVCPVCYCRECFFDSPTFDTEADKFLGRAKARGAIRLPGDTLLFHLTRMNHMAASCVNCGMCSQACPSGIDVGALFSAVGDEVQAVFGYKPGVSLDHEIPFKTFREDELEAFG